MLPDAPWSLSGEVVVALVRRPVGDAARLPEGLRPMPGPALLWAGHWAQTPVGPFSELGLAIPARLGLRPGFCVTVSTVTAPEARIAGRLSWGVPRDLGALRWVALGQTRSLWWEERDIHVHAELRRTRSPFALTIRGIQRRADGPVLVPTKASGWLRRARIRVSAPADDPLAELAGERRGWLLAGRQVVLSPARHPSGLLGSLLAPVRAPEAGLTPRLAPPRTDRVGEPDGTVG